MKKPPPRLESGIITAQLIKRFSLLTLPVLLATLVSLHLKTDEPVSLESIPLEDTKVISRALHFIEKNYVDPEAIHPDRMFHRTSQELERNIAPLIVKERDKRVDLSMGEKRISLPLPNPMTVSDLSAICGRLLGFLNLFYEGRLTQKERLSIAMSGLMETLDPHSNYLSPKVYNEFKIGTKGNFGGLGIVIGIRENDLAVIAPLEGTPAFEAGIKAKDKIVQIGEESTINMGLTEAVEKLRGPAGSKIGLVIRRSGVTAPLKFTLTRAVIRIRSVAGRLLKNGPGKRRFVLIKVKNFQEDTMDQFRKTLKGLEAGGAKLEGVVLDLRNNPGGLLDQAIALADYFLSDGTIVKTVGAKGETIDREEAGPGQPGERLAVVVLVNEGSASASEIVAGALQQNDRAVVLGDRTFGKGTVQTVFDLKDGSAMKLTIAKYLTARDQPVQSIGINPDVGLTAATIGEKTVDLFEDVKRRETDLLNKSDSPTPKPLSASPLQMTYLASAKGEEDEAAGKIDLRDDFPVLLAERILELEDARSLDRKVVLKALPPLLDELKRGESRKIAAAMRQIGIDWSEGEERGRLERGRLEKGRPVASVKVEILTEDKDKKEAVRKGIAAGESGFLKITVENSGNAPFYQLAGVTRSEDPIFANLEFPFGKIVPGEKREWKSPLKMPDLIHRRNVPVEIEFHEQFGRHPFSAPFSIETEGLPIPHFQYRYRLKDDGGDGTSGNGNGRAEAGETIGLLLNVKNTGEGKSRSPVVTLKNLEGDQAFIEKGREEVPEIASGGERESLLRFRIPRRVPRKRLSFELTILDTHLGEALIDRIEIPIGEGDPTPPVETVQTPPVIETTPPVPPLTSDGERYHLKGGAIDDQEIRHLFIFVGDEKVFYRSANGAKGERKAIAFDLTISLKKGANLITIAAQDDRELTTRKQWLVWRK